MAHPRWGQWEDSSQPFKVHAPPCNLALLPWTQAKRPSLSHSPQTQRGENVSTPFPDPLQGWPVSPQGQRARGRGGSCLTVQNHPKRCFPGTSPASLYDWEPQGKAHLLEQQNPGNLPVCAPVYWRAPRRPVCAQRLWSERGRDTGGLVSCRPCCWGWQAEQGLRANSHLSCHSSTALFIRLVQGWEPVSSQAGEYTEASAKLWGSHGEWGAGIQGQGLANFCNLIHAFIWGQWVLWHSHFT